MSDSYFLQVSYAKQVGSRLERFSIKKTSPFLAVARCPICGDSAKKKSKTRFTFYEKNHDINCTCFNCGYSTTIFSFLKENHKDLFDGLLFEKFKLNESETPVIQQPAKPKPISSEQEFDLQLISELPDDHPAKIYISSRQLPEYPFYYAPKFFEFSSKFNPELQLPTKDEARIVIPFFTRDGKIHAFQGRAIEKTWAPKYITIKIDKTKPLLFGVRSLDLTKPIYIVEGPFDSLFLPNCIASVNASLSATAKWFQAGLSGHIKPDIIIVHDNERRNPQIVKEYVKSVGSGFKTVIWPKTLKEKDINEMVMSGLDPLKIIQENTYVGLSASLKLTDWRKT